ncbi:MAG: DUF3604 domain-containing protein [Myxococcota bacterium]
MRRIGIVLAAAVVLAGLGTAYAWWGGSGKRGTIDGVDVAPATAARSDADVAAVATEQRDATRGVGAEPSGQILFGDLHVHTTLSDDAFLLNLPLMGGAGAMTPADACDFARHCAALDFWSINDHAQSLHPEDWKNTVASIRACNDRAGDPRNPDSVAFLGWEWTQAGLSPDEHYGHKNVVLAHTDDARIPARPIAAKARPLLFSGMSPLVRGFVGLLDGRFDDLSRRVAQRTDAPVCGDGPVRTLDADCKEVAPTPADLFRKLDDWGHDAIVIPHGTAWGVYTPPDSSWDKQLAGALHDPDWQTMLEVYSGHGDSEVYRDWRPLTRDGAGEPVCPGARDDYLPVCRQAGRIIRARCLAAGESGAECETRAETARQNAMRAGKDAIATIENGSSQEWLDAGQCRDCNQPSFNYVPTGSAQYIAALGNFGTDPDAPRRFRMGFMASSDNHSARPGTGFKELLTHSDGGFDDPDGAPALGKALRARLGGSGEGAARSVRILPGETSVLSSLAGAERTASFQYTGGLVAVHADGRDRASIWEALERRSIYGTSGPRILLWFELLTEEGALPMGSELESDATPRFRVRAVGSRTQKPGCPDEPLAQLGPDEVARLCVGECYHPGDTRRPIERIDLIRIRPQVRPDEDIGGLIDDPWQSFECDGDAAGCVATFRDDAFPAGGRDTVYYARVFEAPAPTANGTPLNCTRDAAGRCTAVAICGDTEPCLAPDRPRAWSSPIYLDHPSARRSR